jgi:hypothetical protein
MKQLINKIAVALLIISITSCNENFRFVISPRPLAPVITRPLSPGPAHIWIEGEWFWNGGSYTWRNGYWALPHNGYSWRPGLWKRRSNGWYWHRGHWKK